MTPAALNGVTVLDLSSVGPAARASRWLADYGAQVVKVVPPVSGGVQIQPPYYAYGAHRGMRRLPLDLKAAAGVEVFLRLAGNADVVLESFRPGVVRRLGIGYDDVRRRNAAIVYCSTSGFGQNGPYAAWAGHDLNYLALGGYLDLTRHPDGQPALPGTSIADAAAGGMQAVIAILAALLRRATTGDGSYLDVSVADGVVALMSLQVDEYLATRTAPGPRLGILHGQYACYDTYQCADGRWLSVAAIERRFWSNLCGALGLAQWTDAQFDDGSQEKIRLDLRRAFATRTRDEWIHDLAPRDTCVAPVLSVAEVTRDPHLVARGLFVNASHRRHGPFRQVGPALAGAATVPDDVLDEQASDSEELLRAAGFTEEQVRELREAGVVA